jgi:hypothetical protein
VQRRDDNRRSRWPSREGERWWTGAVTYGGGLLSTACLVAVIAAIVLDALWIAVAVLAVVILGAVALAMFADGDWWWN